MFYQNKEKEVIKMQFSYSNHIGGIATTSALSGVGKHNERQYDRLDSLKYRASHEMKDPNENVRLRGSGNIYKDVEEIYRENFQPAIDRYNEKQQREDRQRGDYKEYMQEISKGGQNVAIEMIIQIGSKENFKGVDVKDIKEDFNHLYEKQIEYMEQHLPNFKIASANIHYDESSPHVHIVGVPIGTGYSKGMDTRVSQRQVFNKETMRDFIQRDMRAEMEREVRGVFRDVEFKEKEQGRKFSKSVGAYKEHMDKTAEMEREMRKMEREYERRLESREIDKETLINKDDLTIFGNVKRNSNSLKELVKGYNDNLDDKQHIRQLTSENARLESECDRLNSKHKELERVYEVQRKELEKYREKEWERERQERERMQEREHNRWKNIDKER